MLALVLDTSTPAVTAGLVDLSDLRVVAEAVQVDGRRHGELLALNLREVLRAGAPETVAVPRTGKSSARQWPGERS